MLPPPYLENHEAVTAAFGYLPAFHDAPLLSFLQSGASAEKIDLVIHGFHMTRETNEKGYFRLIRHHHIHFQFDGIAEVHLENFTIPNTLFEMEFPSLSDAGRFHVRLDSVMGGDCFATFSAASARVMSVTPIDEPSRA